jgi:hypothetical protein
MQHYVLQEYHGMSYFHDRTGMVPTEIARRWKFTSNEYAPVLLAFFFLFPPVPFKIREKDLLFSSVEFSAALSYPLISLVRGVMSLP